MLESSSLLHGHFEVLGFDCGQFSMKTAHSSIGMLYWFLVDTRREGLPTMLSEDDLWSSSEMIWWDEEIVIDGGIFVNGFFCNFHRCWTGRMNDLMFDNEAWCPVHLEQFVVDKEVLPVEPNLSVNFSSTSPDLSCPGVIMIGSGPELMRTGAIDMIIS
ncbi:hypothetical protein Tco_0444862 [Tanacetum coccineum]